MERWLSPGGGSALIKGPTPVGLEDVNPSLVHVFYLSSD